MAQPAFIDYYKTLEVASTATNEQIRAAYIALAKKSHPDTGGTVKAMRQLNQAYGTLRNENARNEYDVRYRKHVLGEKVSDLSFTDNDDWDLDDVDEFLNEVFQEDQRRKWVSPLAIGLAVAGLGVLLFFVFSALRMTATSNTVEALPKPPTERGQR